MKIKKFEFNMFPVNCYVLSDETKEAEETVSHCHTDYHGRVPAENAHQEDP